MMTRIYSIQNVFLIIACILSSILFALEDDTKSQEDILWISISKQFFVDVNTNDVKVAIEVWAKKFVENYDKINTPKAVIFDDLESIEHAIKTDKLDVITLTTLEYLELSKKIALFPINVASTGEEPFDTFVLLVHRDDEITMLNQLKGKNVNIPAGASSRIIQIWLDVMLMKQGLPQGKNFFGSIKEVNKPSQALLPVFFKNIDACIVTQNSYNTMTELNPQILQRLVILEKSAEFVKEVHCHTSNVIESEKELLNKAYIELQTSITGKQILAIFKRDKFIPFKPFHLKNARELLEEYNNLKVKTRIE